MTEERAEIILTEDIDCTGKDDLLDIVSVDIDSYLREMWNPCVWMKRTEIPFFATPKPRQIAEKGRPHDAIPVYVKPLGQDGPAQTIKQLPTYNEHNTRSRL